MSRSNLTEGLFAEALFKLRHGKRDALVQHGFVDAVCLNVSKGFVLVVPLAASASLDQFIAGDVQTVKQRRRGKFFQVVQPLNYTLAFLQRL